MKIAAIIQARMGSTRLPGKILMNVLDKPLLKYQIERVKRAKMLDEIIIATTTEENDNEIVYLCEELSISYYRGSEEDVLKRYYEAATKYEVDVVVRLTSDCPLIDPRIVDETIELFLTDKYDYVSNSLENTYPRGMDTEVFFYKGLEKIYHEALKSYEREHVTPYFYRNPEQFRLNCLRNNKDLSKYRLTVDTPEDFELIKKILEEIYPKKQQFSLEDIMETMNNNPDWYLINSHIEQKNLKDK